MAVSYILAVNPAILGGTGMDRGGVFLATALAGFIGTLSMALYANKPLVLGICTTTTFAESAVGIGAGTRTGLAALTAAVLFIVSIVGALIFLAIPGFATAPVLMIVGFLMIKSTVNIDWNDWPVLFRHICLLSAQSLPTISATVWGWRSYFTRC